MDLKKINNTRVKAIPQEKEEDISKWRGSKIFMNIILIYFF